MKKLKVMTTVTLLLCFVSLGWLLFYLVAFRSFISGLTEGPVDGTKTEILFFVGLLILFPFHLLSLIAIVSQFYHEKRIGVIRVLSLFAGTISLLLLFSDRAMMHDIYQQTQHGMDSSGEWIIYYSSQVFHLLFALLSLWINFSFLKSLKVETGSEPALKDETLFLSAQIIGIACAVLGLAVLCLGFGYAAPRWYVVPRMVLVTVSVVILSPYALVACCWLAVKLREKNGGWYDEKQFTDITKAGFLTLLVLLPCMVIVYSIEYFGVLKNINFLWLFIYVFLTLGVFSGGTLFFSTRG